MNIVKSWIATLSVLVLLTLGLVAGAQADAYTFVSLGTLGGQHGTANAVNDGGQVVGAADTSSGVSHAFLWQNGVMTDIGTLGGAASAAYGINNLGQVVGQSTTTSGVTHAFLWQNGVMVDLGTLGGTTSSAKAINDNGQIVGSSTLANGHTHAFLYENGVMTDMGVPAAGASNDYSDAVDINANGQVLGSYKYTTQYNCGDQVCTGALSTLFTYSNGTFTDGPVDVTPYSINDNGDYVYKWQTTDPFYNVTTYYSARIQATGTTLSLPFNTSTTFYPGAYINNSGKIVGGWNYPQSPAIDARLYDPVTSSAPTIVWYNGYPDLWFFSSHAISNTGYIAGSGNGYSGTGVAFLLVPYTSSASDLFLNPATAPSVVTSGDTLSYNITIDPKFLNASGVTLTDILPGGVTLVSATFYNNTFPPSTGGCSGTTTITCNVGDIGFVDTASVVITVTADVVGEIVNNISVSSSLPDAYPLDNSVSLTTIVAPPETADLAVSIDGPTQALYPGTVTYQLHVVNNGPDNVTSVTLKDTHWGSTSTSYFVSAVPSAGTCSDNYIVLTCNIGGLASGANATVTLVLRSPGLGTSTQSLVVTSNASDPSSANNSASLSTTFSPATYYLNLTKAGNGSGIVIGAGTYDTGTTATVSAAANTGSTFAGWTGTNAAECATGSVLMNANKSCTATFTLNTYTLSLSTAGNGSGTVTGAGTYNYGTNVPITVTASTGSSFAGWSGTDAAECATLSVSMIANKSCTATFTLNTYTLSLSTAGNGSGTVTGAGTYNYGTNVPITVTASTGSTFTGWSGTDAAECATLSVSMIANKSCTATFTLNTYTLSLSTAGNGSGTVTGAGTYNYGTNVPITITASAGSSFGGWTGTDATECATLTVSMIADKSCTATFTLNAIADLIPTALTASTSGSSLVIKDSVKNQGTATAGAFSIGYYLSSDTTYDAGDAYVCGRTVSSLATGASNPASGTTTTTCALPAVTAGAYYVLVVDDAGNVIAESNESNNVRATSTTVNVGPDLIPTALSASKAGSKVSVSDKVKNQGTANVSSAFSVSYYLSTDTGYQAGTDLALASSSNGSGMCSRSIGSLKAGSDNAGGATCYKPTAAKSGVKYYVLAVDDAGNVIGEYNETNNVKATSGTISW